MKKKTTPGEETQCLIVKKYGGNIHHELGKKIFRMNPPLIQSLIFFELSNRGWGPKLHGLLEDGRVEEYIDCDTLQPCQAFLPEIIVDMAQTFARFHSIDVPIDRTLYFTIDETVNALQHVPAIKEWIRLTPPEPDVLKAVNCLLEFPSQQEYEWCKRMISRTRHRTVLCTMDANYLNRLVRKSKPQDPRANKTVIIDFDISAYSHRGYDLGGHLVNSMFEVGVKKARPGNYPSKRTRETFLTAYLKESEKLLPDFDGDSLDSLQNLMIETDVYACVYLLWLILLAHIFCKSPQVTNYYYYEPAIIAYRQLKQQFCTENPHIAKED